ncbi:MAG: hypothetical protein WBB04_11310 [Candidatus Macondimonas sp.]
MGRAEQAVQARCRRGSRKLQVDTPLFTEVCALMNQGLVSVAGWGDDPHASG